MAHFLSPEVFVRRVVTLADWHAAARIAGVADDPDVNYYLEYNFGPRRVRR